MYAVFFNNDPAPIPKWLIFTLFVSAHGHLQNRQPRSALQELMRRRLRQKKLLGQAWIELEWHWNSAADVWMKSFVVARQVFQDLKLGSSPLIPCQCDYVIGIL